MGWDADEAREAEEHAETLAADRSWEDEVADSIDVEDDPGVAAADVDELLDGLSPELREVMEASRTNWDRAGYADRKPDVPDEEEHGPLRTSTGGVIRCEFCGDEIPSTRNAYRKVVGYERQRRQGGTNAVRIRKPTDDYACASCVDAVAAGRDPRQEAVF